MSDLGLGGAKTRDGRETFGRALRCARNLNRIVAGVCLVLLLHGSERVLGGASILLSAPNPSLNAALGQVVEVSLVNDDAVQYDLSGTTFVLKIGDGVSSGPTIQSIDLVGAGLFFAGKGQSTVAGGNDRTKAETAFSFTDVSLAASQTVALARFTLDATGTSGTFGVSFDQPNILNQSTIFQGSNVPNITLNAGTITVVPEPSTYYVAFAVLMLGFARWSRQHQQAG